MAVFDSDVHSEQVNWLDGLPNHAIFSPSGNRLGRQCMVVRNSDLIVASDKSLRMMSLLEVKHQASSSSSSSSSKGGGTFKELVSESLDFTIAEIILNPTGKLVAVVGSHRVVVVVLPRPGVYLSKSIGAQVSVKAATVGTFYFHERVGGRAKMATVKWHPWGHLGSSLLVMSKDGLLREFDVSNDVQEPVQTVSLLPSSPKQNSSCDMQTKTRMRRSLRSRSRSQTPILHRSVRGSSRIAFDDDDDDEDNFSGGDQLEDASFARSRGSSGPAAVTFTFGIDDRNAEDMIEGSSSKVSDWKPLSLYTLCTNGDVYALCPFMPKNASMPFSYLSSLSSLVSKQPSSSQGFDGDIQNRYLSSLLKQARTIRRDQDQSTSLSLQSRRSVSATPMSLDPRDSAPPDEPAMGDISNELVLLQAPPLTMVPRQPRPQGPFLFRPAPIELSEDRENISTDMFFARAESGQDSLDLLGILGDDGRVDLCVLLEAIEPQWGESLQITPTKKKRVASSGRYALSDSDDDADDQEYANRAARVDRPLPTLYVYETIDLGLSFSENHRSQLPRFVLDPLYSDTVYIQHTIGAHAIGFGKWSKNLLAALALPEEERAPAMGRVLHVATPSDVIQVVDSSSSSTQDSNINEVTGLCIISDIYLSYSFLALTHSGSLVALELGLRVEDNDNAVQQIDTLKTDLQAGPAPYTSLLGDGPPFVPPEPFKTVNGLPYHPRSAIKGRHSSQEIVVTTETLRNLATVVSTLRGEMRKIVQGGNIVQSRLELQIKELNRQLSKLNEQRCRLDQGQVRQEKLDQRIQRVLEKQGSLVKTSDWLLQKLVENHSPEVSIYEAKWFKELERLKEGVGSKEIDSGEAQGLHARVSKLQYQLEKIRPDLIKMKEMSVKEASEMMGAKQLQRVESMLAKEAQLLAANRDVISHLQSRMQQQRHKYVLVDANRSLILSLSLTRKYVVVL